MEGLKPFKDERELSKGEKDQQDTVLAVMGLELIGWTLTENEKTALGIMIGAIKREAPKTSRSQLVTVINMVTKAVT